MNWPLTVLMDFAQYGFDLREQVVGGVAAQVFDARLIHAQAVAAVPGRSRLSGA